MFHFALNPGGYLFLGTAEGTGDDERLFAAVSKRWRIFVRSGRLRRAPADFPILASDATRPERSTVKASPGS